MYRFLFDSYIYYIKGFMCRAESIRLRLKNANTIEISFIYLILIFYLIASTIDFISGDALFILTLFGNNGKTAALYVAFIFTPLWVFAILIISEFDCLIIEEYELSLVNKYRWRKRVPRFQQNST